jgi:hypothetical protein
VVSININSLRLSLVLCHVDVHYGINIILRIKKHRRANSRIKEQKQKNNNAKEE